MGVGDGDSDLPSRGSERSDVGSGGSRPGVRVGSSGGSDGDVRRGFFEETSSRGVGAGVSGSRPWGGMGSNRGRALGRERGESGATLRSAGVGRVGRADVPDVGCRPPLPRAGVRTRPPRRTPAWGTPGRGGVGVGPQGVGAGVALARTGSTPAGRYL